MSKKPLKVVELFAGVGGFREALDHSYSAEAVDGFKFVWSNQWEPNEAGRAPEEQSANRVYLKKFGGDGTHFPDDIHNLTASDGPLQQVPEKFDLLVGGFPCQDYSVAKPKNASKGIRGPKGVLWWSIERILRERKPKYALLENVDRLLASPANNRGRDFAVILDGLLSEGYVVEWRVVDASEYGYPQRRRRVFILAYREGSPVANRLGSLRKGSPEAAEESARSAILETGVLAGALPCSSTEGTVSAFDFERFASDDDLGRRYVAQGAKSPFLNAGFARGSTAWSLRVEPKSDRPQETLADVIASVKTCSDAAAFRLKDAQLDAWRYAKGAKNEPRRKMAVLKSYLRSRLQEERREASSGLLSELAKKMPERLEMDAAVGLDFNRRRIEVRIAREELNQRIARELGLPGVRLDRPVALTRTQIAEARRSPEVWERVTESMAALVAERAATQLGTRDKTLREAMAQTARDNLVSALKALVKERSELIDGILFNRDEVAAKSFAYGYKEGGMQFPDSLDAPGRTIITSEGGASVSRFKHVICEICAGGRRHRTAQECVDGRKLRRLFPEELERMNGFGERHSEVCRDLGISDAKRAFFMGNALVVGIVRDIGRALRDADRDA